MAKSKSKTTEYMSTFKQKFKWKRSTEKKEQVVKVPTVKARKKHLMKEKSVEKNRNRSHHAKREASRLNATMDVWKNGKVLNIMQRDKPMHRIERKLPGLRPLEMNVPWSLENEGTERPKFEPAVPSCAAYKDFVSKASLLQLDIELENFAKYVRLTKHEILTRKTIISQIESLLLSMWPQVQVQQFGSFATEEVCTFASDIDLAFWGIVPLEDGGTSRNEWNDGSVCMTQESYRRTMETIENRKKERVLAWEKLLADVDRQSFQNESDISQSDHNKSNEELFVVDRSGVQMVHSENVAQNINSDNDSDSHDSVDKMSEYHRREHAGNTNTSRDVFADSISSSNNFKKPESDLDSSTIDEFHDDERNHSDFEINVSAENVTDFGAPLSELINADEMSTNHRMKAVNALVRLGKKLWKQSYAQNVHVRKKARVPIICMTTRYGFDADMAIGGHNGMDTSNYVRKCIDKFENFSTVVLFLKILLQQTDLDKPYTGGLGSYRLYVLVAKHFNEHMNIGGGVSAAEVLLSFFYRYSSYGEKSTKARTHLDKSYTIFSEDGEADLSAVNVEDCVEIFRLCFQRLIGRLAEFDDCYANSKRLPDQQCNLSLITCLIDVTRLKRDRVVVMNKSQTYTPIQKIPDDHPGKVTCSSTTPISHTFSKHPFISKQQSFEETKSPAHEDKLKQATGSINRFPKSQVPDTEKILQDMYESRKTFRFVLFGNGVTMEITSSLGPIKSSCASDIQTGERMITFASNDHSFEFHVKVDRINKIVFSEEKKPSEEEKDFLRCCRFIDNDGGQICSLILVDSNVNSIAWFRGLMNKYAQKTGVTPTNT